jgi:LemA protein
MEITLIILAILAALVIGGVLMYNKLVSMRVRVKEAWADIDVQLKRRYDLIPNLVNAVKGYMTHEKETLQKVTEARTMAMNAGTVADQSAAENMLTGALKSLFAVSESYPDLKANQNFLQLQQELTDTENKIQAARRFYNGNVRDINTAVQTVPQNIIASMFGFSAEEFFELDEGSEQRENVEVKF